MGKSMGGYTPVDDKVFICGDLVMLESMAEGMEHHPPDDDRYFKWNSYFVFHKDSAWGLRYETRYPDSSRRAKVGWPIIRDKNDSLPMGILGAHPHLAASWKDNKTGTTEQAFFNRDSALLYFNKYLREAEAGP